MLTYISAKFCSTFYSYLLTVYCMNFVKNLMQKLYKKYNLLSTQKLQIKHNKHTEIYKETSITLALIRW